jgi:ligand-binding sensor domain-containing protein
MRIDLLARTLLPGAGLVVLTAIAQGQTWEVFDMSTAGLPSNTVRAIAHDASGGTWVGTDWGLCYYDGIEWTVYQTSQGLPENDVRALAFDQTGRLWAGFFTQGLGVKDGDEWTSYMPGTSPMPSDQVRNIAFDAQGYAWLATTNGLARTDLTEWRIYNNSDTSWNNQTIPGVNIADVAVRDDGLVCIGTLNAGFVYLTTDEVVVYNSVENALPDNTALGVAIDSDGDRWAACPAGGLLRFSGPYDGGLIFQFITGNSGIPTNALNDIVIDGDDRKYIATQSAGIGMLAADNTTWTEWSTWNSDLPDNAVNCVSLAPDGALWAGTETGGVARLDIAASIRDRHDRPAPHVWPNPTTGPISIIYQGGGAVRWRLMTSTGQVVGIGSETAGRGTGIDLRDLPPGVYILLIEWQGHTTSTRVVRN